MTVLTIKKLQQIWTEEQRKDNKEQVEYLKYLNSRFGAKSFNRWSITKNFSEDGINIIKDKNELNKRFVAKLKNDIDEYDDSPEQWVKGDMSLACLADKLGREKETAIKSEIQSYRSGLHRKYNSIKSYMESLSNLERQLLEFRPDESIGKKVEESVAKIVAEGAWHDPRLYKNTTRFFMRAKRPLVLSHFDARQGVSVGPCDLGYFGIMLDAASRTLLRAFPVYNNSSASYRWHPHLSGDQLCLGTVAERMKLAKTHDEVAAAAWEALTAYYPGDCYVNLSYWNNKKPNGRIVTDVISHPYTKKDFLNETNNS